MAVRVFNDTMDTIVPHISLQKIIIKIMLEPVHNWNSWAICKRSAVVTFVLFRISERIDLEGHEKLNFFNFHLLSLESLLRAIRTETRSKAS